MCKRELAQMNKIVHEIGASRAENKHCFFQPSKMEGKCAAIQLDTLFYTCHILNYLSWG